MRKDKPTVWVVNFDEMKVEEGKLIARGNHTNSHWIRIAEGNIDSLVSVNQDNVFDTKEAASRRLFKAKLEGPGDGIKVDFGFRRLRRSYTGVVHKLSQQRDRGRASSVH